VPMNLDELMASRHWARLGELYGWCARRSDDLIVVELEARDGEWYSVLLDCPDYPAVPPNVGFVDGEGSLMDPEAWPAGTPRFHEVVKPPPACFLCMPLTRQGMSAHQEWTSTSRVGAWDPERHTLLDIVNYVQLLLRSKQYLGRGPGAREVPEQGA